MKSVHRKFRFVKIIHAPSTEVWSGCLLAFIDVIEQLRQMKGAKSEN